VRPPILAPQPLPVEEMRAAELRTQTGATEPLDRLTKQELGGLAVTHERPGPGMDPERPLAGSYRGRRSNAFKRADRRCAPVTPGCSLEQLDGRPDRDEQLRRVVARFLRGGESLRIAAEAVEENRPRPVGVLDRGALASRGELLDHAVDQRGGFGLAAPKAP